MRMRDIKFRAYYKGNEWTDDKPVMLFDVQNTYDGGAKDKYGDYLLGWLSSFGEILDTDEFVVMQYTGKRDKNDQEVYLNDIVEDEYGYRYEVVFKGDCLRCDGIRRDGYRPKNRWFSNHLKIVGNRYENPELLKENAE